MRRSGAKALARAGQSIASIQHTGRGGSLAVVACVEEAREEFLPAIQGGTFEPTEMEQTLGSAASACVPSAGGLCQLLQLLQLATDHWWRTGRTDLEDRPLVEKLEALSGSGWAFLK